MQTGPTDPETKVTIRIEALRNAVTVTDRDDELDVDRVLDIAESFEKYVRHGRVRP